MRDEDRDESGEREASVLEIMKTLIRLEREIEFHPWQTDGARAAKGCACESLRSAARHLAEANAEDWVALLRDAARVEEEGRS